MPSIQLQIRKTNQDFTDKAVKTLSNGDDQFFLHEIWFKKIETMDKSNDLYVEYREDELPEEILKQINEDETGTIADVAPPRLINEMIKKYGEETIKEWEKMFNSPEKLY